MAPVEDMYFQLVLFKWFKSGFSFWVVFTNTVFPGPELLKGLFRFKSFVVPESAHSLGFCWLKAFMTWLWPIGRDSCGCCSWGGSTVSLSCNWDPVSAVPPFSFLSLAHLPIYFWMKLDQYYSSLAGLDDSFPRHFLYDISAFLLSSIRACFFIKTIYNKKVPSWKILLESKQERAHPNQTMSSQKSM